MILVANRIFVAPAHRDAFEHMFATRARLVDHMKGFIANQVLKPLSAGDPYVIQTLWESRADFVAWTKSEEFTAGHARTPELPLDAFTAPTKLEVHEVFQQTNWPYGVPSNGTTAQD